MNMHQIPSQTVNWSIIQSKFSELAAFLMRICSDLGTWVIETGVLLLALSFPFPAKGTFCKRYNIVEKSQIAMCFYFPFILYSLLTIVKSVILLFTCWQLEYNLQNCVFLKSI